MFNMFMVDIFFIVFTKMQRGRENMDRGMITKNKITHEIWIYTYYEFTCRSVLI